MARKIGSGYQGSFNTAHEVDLISLGILYLKKKEEPFIHQGFQGIENQEATAQPKPAALALASNLCIT